MDPSGFVRDEYHRHIIFDFRAFPTLFHQLQAGVLQGVDIALLIDDHLANDLFFDHLAVLVLVLQESVRIKNNGITWLHLKLINIKARVGTETKDVAAALDASQLALARLIEKGQAVTGIQKTGLARGN